MLLSLVFEFISLKLRKTSIDERKHQGQIRKKYNLLIIMMLGVTSDDLANSKPSTMFAKTDFIYFNFFRWIFILVFP